MSNTGSTRAPRRLLAAAIAVVTFLVTPNCASAGAVHGPAAAGTGAGRGAGGRWRSHGKHRHRETGAVFDVPDPNRSIRPIPAPGLPMSGAASSRSASIRTGRRTCSGRSPGIPRRCTVSGRSPAYLRQRSMVPAVDQLLMGLRAAWLCRSEALWAELAAEARGVRPRRPRFPPRRGRARCRLGPLGRTDAPRHRRAVSRRVPERRFLGRAPRPATTCRSSSTPSSAARSTSCWRRWPTVSACSRTSASPIACRRTSRAR